jgi:hypothetical protein
MGNCLKDTVSFLNRDSQNCGIIPIPHVQFHPDGSEREKFGRSSTHHPEFCPNNAAEHRKRGSSFSFCPIDLTQLTRTCDIRQNMSEPVMRVMHLIHADKKQNP